MKKEKNIHPKELIDTGLAPQDFELVDCICSPRIAKEMGYHPADQHREEHMERHDGK